MTCLNPSPNGSASKRLPTLNCALWLSILCSAMFCTTQAQAAATQPSEPTRHSPKQPKKPPTAGKSQSKKAPKTTAPSGLRLQQNPELALWAQEASSRLPIDSAWLNKTMAQAQRLPLVEKLVLPAAKPASKDWAAYRARFIEPIRIQAGVQFWQKHRLALERAERDYGVPASVIVAVMGVETLYGQNTGNFRVLDALGTLAFHFPQAHPRAAERQAFFRRELEQFLQLTHASADDPLKVKGSFAGAMGLPQFMPSSWAKFAVDFDGDGRIDLFGSPTDAIGSVGHYFRAFNWQTGMPTHYPVKLSLGQTDMDSLLAPDILPTFSVASFVGKGAALEGAALAHTGPLALIELRNGNDAPSYVAGTDNFYAITRYNWSSYYAMAVIELAEAVERAVKAAP